MTYQKIMNNLNYKQAVEEIKLNDSRYLYKFHQMNHFQFSFLVCIFCLFEDPSKCFYDMNQLNIIHLFCYVKTKLVVIF